MRWFEDNGVVLTDWPPYNPDLNPIEHLGYELKKLVYQVCPDIDGVTESEDTIREALQKALEEAWILIDTKMMKDLIESIDRRVKAVIGVEGWYTKQ